MQKNDVLRYGESIIRVLDVRENQVLIVTYPQKTVPLWINQEVLSEYHSLLNEYLQRNMHRILIYEAANA